MEICMASIYILIRVLFEHIQWFRYCSFPNFIWNIVTLLTHGSLLKALCHYIRAIFLVKH